MSSSVTLGFGVALHVFQVKGLCLGCRPGSKCTLESPRVSAGVPQELFLVGPKEPLLIVDLTFRQVPFSHVSSQFPCYPIGRSIVSKVGAKIECFPGVSVAVRLAG